MTPPNPFDPIPDDDRDSAAERIDPFLDGAIDADPVEEEPEREKCWRCGKSVIPQRGLCPSCNAVLRKVWDRHPRREAIAPIGDSTGKGIKVVLWAFVILLSLSVVQGWTLTGKDLQNLPRQEVQSQLLTQMLIFEALDTLVVLIAFALIATPRPVERIVKSRTASWLLAVPVLAALLGLNLFYHTTLSNFVGKPPHLEFIEIDFKGRMLLVILLICVQPMIVEEIFFRYVALGYFQSVMGVHAAVWVSSVMFGLAHLHVPLSMPMLTLVGVGLGYMRVMSGSLLLPMLMHGLHNACVLALEGKV